MLGGVGVELTPEVLNGDGLVGETALNKAETGQVAFFRIRIECDRGVVPKGMGPQMDGGIEPITPALDGLAGPENRFGWIGRKVGIGNGNGAGACVLA